MLGRRVLRAVTGTIMLASSAGIVIAGGHRVQRHVTARPFLDPRIDRLMMRPLTSRQAQPGVDDGPEIVVVLIGSAGCAASRQNTLSNAMDQLRATLLEASSRQGLRVAFLGVALDTHISSGLRWLTSVGPFDQVSVGGNWLNLAAVQIVVLRRVVTIASDSQSVVVEPDVLVSRLRGVQEIINWATSDEPRVLVSRSRPPRD
jgi:hypothetical protein